MFHCHRHKKPKHDVDLDKIKRHIETLDKAIDIIKTQIAEENDETKKDFLTEKRIKLLSNRAWFRSIYTIEKWKIQSQLEEENYAFCLFCDIIREYDKYYCIAPELNCGKKKSEMNKKTLDTTREIIDDYKEGLI